jgi:hypothetical protein
MTDHTTHRPTGSRPFRPVGPTSPQPITRDAHGVGSGPAGSDAARTIPAARRRCSRRAPRTGRPRPSGWLAGRRHHLRRPTAGRLARAVVTVVVAGVAVAVWAGPAFADPPTSLTEVITRITAWLVGIAAGLATLFLTYGAVRYLSAGGDPGSVEKAKTALRSAALGYGLALLAPLVVTVLNTFVS